MNNEVNNLTSDVIAALPRKPRLSDATLCACERCQIIRLERERDYYMAVSEHLEYVLTYIGAGATEESDGHTMEQIGEIAHAAKMQVRESEMK